MPVRTQRVCQQATQDGGLQAGPASSAAGAPAFASLPLEIHRAIRENLSAGESIALSGLAKALVAPAGFAGSMS
jgi:hypothetical protein